MKEGMILLHSDAKRGFELKLGFVNKTKNYTLAVNGNPVEKMEEVQR